MEVRNDDIGRLPRARPPRLPDTEGDAECTHCGKPSIEQDRVDNSQHSQMGSGVAGCGWGSGLKVHGCLAFVSRQGPRWTLVDDSYQ